MTVTERAEPMDLLDLIGPTVRHPHQWSIWLESSSGSSRRRECVVDGCTAVQIYPRPAPVDTRPL